MDGQTAGPGLVSTGMIRIAILTLYFEIMLKSLTLSKTNSTAANIVVGWIAMRQWLVHAYSTTRVNVVPVMTNFDDAVTQLPLSLKSRANVNAVPSG
jgi:hypothetical protein